MKNNILFIFLLFSSVALAQKGDTCELFTNDAVIRFFDSHIANGSVAPEYIHLFFNIEDAKTMTKFGSWARLNGYETEERKTETLINGKEKDMNYFFLIEKKVEEKTLPYLKSTIYQVFDEMKILGIDKCTGLGTGGKTMEYMHKKK